MRHGWLRAGFSALLLLLLAAPPAASDVGDTYERVLRTAALHFDLRGDPEWTGTAEDELYNVVLCGRLSDQVRVGFKLTAYRDAAAKRRQLLFATAFAAPEAGGGAPAQRTSSRTLGGVLVEESDRPAFVTESPLGSATIPRSREMRVEVSDLLTFSVATGEGRDPTPYMVKLIEELRREELLGPAQEAKGLLLHAEKEGFLPEDRRVELGDLSPSSITILGWVLDQAGDPVAGVRVEASALESTAVTDSEGAFRLHGASNGSVPFDTRAVLTLKASGPGVPGVARGEQPEASDTAPPRQGLPWLVVLGGLFLVLGALGTRVNVLRRLLAACFVAPLMTATLMALGQMAMDEGGAESSDFLVLILSPSTAWQSAEIWLPAAAWLAGGLTAGLIMGGPLRAMFAGLLMPLAPWVIIHRPWIAAMPRDLEGVEQMFQGLASGSMEDLLTILVLSVFGGGLGALFLPRRSPRE